MTPDNDPSDPNIDSTLIQAAQGIQSLSAHLEDKYTAVLDALSEFASGWIQATARTLVVDLEPDVTEEIGPDAVASLKQDLRSLERSVPRLIKEHVGAEELWAHRGGNPEWHGMDSISDFYWPAESDASEGADLHIYGGLAVPIRTVLDHAVRVLNRYGYMVSEPNGPQAQSVLVTPEVAQLLKEYSEGINELGNARNRYGQLLYEVRKQRAGELWDGDKDGSQGSRPKVRSTRAEREE